MKFPKTNPFAQPAACWQMRFDVPQSCVLAVEDSFAEEALSIASFEQAEDDSRWQVTLHLAAPIAPQEVEARLAHLRRALNEEIATPDVSEVEMEDWANVLQRDFPPVRAGRFFVHGAHAKGALPAGAWPIEVEAGMAFGSGEHATTRGCLLMIERLAKQRHPAMRVLDMGCGSGILAIGIARAWPKAQILAVDIDVPSVKIAKENIALNRLRPKVRALAGDGYRLAAVKRQGPYHLIAANILARPLIAFSHALRSQLAPGGVAVLSGLLTTQVPMVLAAHRRQGLVLNHHYTEAGWSTLVMQR